MKIALDYREAAAPNRAGKGEHVYQLTKALFAIAPAGVEFVLLVSAGQKVDLPQHPYKTMVFPARGAMWHVLVTLWLTFTRPVDLYFSTTSVIIPAFVLGLPVVTTLFDFTAWRFPETHNAHAHWIERWFMALAVRRSKKLIAISEFTKNEAINLFRINPDKIVVTPLAVDTNVFKPQSLTSQEQQKIREKYNLPEKFLLCLATIEPRKNMPAAMQAFKRLHERHPELKLVLAGGRGWKTEETLQGADDRIVITGYIDDADRPAIYSLASVFIFPSLYEGFGLPPLEAMAVGTPTIVSDRASLPEVAGKVATQVSLENPNKLDGAIEQLLEMTSAERIAWSKSAVAWAKTFSWEETARKTLGVLLQYGKG